MFSSAINIIAFFVTLIGVLAALGYTAYLWQLDRVARSRPGGDSARALIRKRMPVSLGTSAVGVLGFLLALGSGVPTDIIGMVLAAGAGSVGINQLRQANRQL